MLAPAVHNVMMTKAGITHSSEPNQPGGFLTSIARSAPLIRPNSELNIHAHKKALAMAGTSEGR